MFCQLQHAIAYLKSHFAEKLLSSSQYSHNRDSKGKDIMGHSSSAYNLMLKQKCRKPFFQPNALAPVQVEKISVNGAKNVENKQPGKAISW